MNKLFIWYDVLTDYTPGIAFAIAESEEEARNFLIKKEPCLKRDEYFIKTPRVYDLSTKMSYYNWGGI